MDKQADKALKIFEQMQQIGVQQIGVTVLGGLVVRLTVKEGMAIELNDPGDAVNAQFPCQMELEFKCGENLSEALFSV